MTETTEQTEAPAKVILTEDQLDDLGRMILAKVTEASAVVAKGQKVIDAANADDANLLVMNLRDTHPSYDEYQSLVEQAEALVKQIDADNKPKVKLPSEEEVTAAEELVAATRDEAKNAIDYLSKAYGTEYDLSEIVPANLAKRRGRKPGSCTGATGAKRPRLSNIVVKNTAGETILSLTHGAEKADEKATFSNLAKWISNEAGTKVEVQALQNHAFEKAGTQDLSTVNGPVEFSVTIGETHYFVAVEARQS